MSKRQVFFVKASSAAEAVCDVGIETIGSAWPDKFNRIWMVSKTAERHQRGRFKVVCTYKKDHHQTVRITVR